MEEQVRLTHPIRWHLDFALLRLASVTVPGGVTTRIL